MKIARIIVLLAMVFSLTSCGSQPQSSQEHLEKAIEYGSQGKFKKSLRTYKKVPKGDPFHEAAKEGIFFIEEALDKRIKKDVIKQLFKGLHSYAEWKLDESIVEFEKAIFMDPKFIPAYLFLAETYVYKIMYDEAIAQCEKAIAVDPQYALAYVSLGSAYFYKGMFDESINEHNKALAIDPNSYQAYAGLGFAYAEKGVSDEAISAFKKVLDINPDSGPAHQYLTDIYFMKGQYDLVLQHYHQAIALGVTFPPEWSEALKTFIEKQSSDHNGDFKVTTSANIPRLSPVYLYAILLIIAIVIGVFHCKKYFWIIFISVVFQLTSIWFLVYFFLISPSLVRQGIVLGPIPGFARFLLGVLFPAWFAVCAIGLLLRKNWARILTIILSVFMLLPLAIGLFEIKRFLIQGIAGFVGLIPFLLILLFFVFPLFYLNIPKVKELFRKNQSED